MSKKFLWGASESGFQFEMGDKEGKAVDSNTDWFAWVHDQGNIENKIVSGDLPEDGIDYWHRYKRDHELARGIGMNAYRIGIEWSRILKDTTGIEIYTKENEDTELYDEIVVEEEDMEKLLKHVNNEAVAHYREIIKDLREKGFKVIVCLNHFTLPLWIHHPIRARDSNLKEGPLGWVSKKTIVEFVKYVSVAGHLFGDLVDMWATLNEPFVVATIGYLIEKEGFPPGVASPEGFFNVAYNITNAHVRAYDALKKWDTIKADEDSTTAAFVGLIHNMSPAHPLDPSNEEDIQAAKVLDYVMNRWIINAVLKGEVDLDLDFEISDEEKLTSFRNRLDWFGLNYYTRNVVKKAENPLVPGLELASFELVKDYGSFCKPNSKSRDNRTTTGFGWEIYPEGLRELLNELSDYNMPIYITENGIADAADSLRPKYLVDHINQLELAMKEDKVKVHGYLHWALTDNYEWAAGYKMRFGLIEVNLETKKRKLRESAYIFKEIAENNGITDELRKVFL